MKYHYYAILLIVILLSCKKIKENTAQEISNPRNKNNLIEKKQDCKSRNYDTFKSFTLNGIKSYEFNINKFIENNRKPDSIVDGYYYYGKSSFLFANNELITVDIIDENLYFDNFLSIETSFLEVKNKFPCSFENRGKTEFYNVKCDVVTLYDDSFNKIRIYVFKENILGIWYTIDESDFDQMNKGAW